MSNWLHINPVSGTGSVQLEIRAEDNVLGVIRKAKIIVTAGTMTRTIDVVQGIADCDIFAVYNQPYSVKLVEDRSLLAMVVVSSEYGEITLTPESGVDWNKISTNTTYFGDGRIPPSQITVKFFFKDDFDGVLPANMFQNIENVDTFEVRDRITTLSPETFKNNTDLTHVKLYSGVTGYSGTVYSGTSVGNVYYSMPNAVAVNCPNLYDFYGDSPLIVTGTTIPSGGAILVYDNMLIGVVQYASITDYLIPDGITGLTSYVFSKGGASPSEITIPNSVIAIGSNCFEGQTGLSALTLSSGLTSLGSYVFSGCTNLLSITCNAVTAPPVNNYTFSGISTGGTLYYPQESDYTSWFRESDTSRLLAYYHWIDGMPPIMTISQTQLVYSNNGGGLNITITANKGGWMLQPTENWITLSSYPGSGVTEHTITCSSYAGSGDRTGYTNVVYNNQVISSITVIQLESSVVPVVTTDKDYVLLGTSYHSSGNVHVTSNTPCDLVYDTSWLETITGSDWTYTTTTIPSGTTNISIRTKNSGTKIGTIEIKNHGITYKSIDVIQASAIATASPTSLTFDYNQVGIASGISVTISSLTDNYTIQTNGDWLSVSGTPASGSVVFTAYTLYENTGGTKDGSIKVIYKNTEVLTIPVKFNRDEELIVVTPETLLFEAEADTPQYFTIESQVPFTYEVEYETCGNDWLTVSGTPTVGTTTLYICPSLYNGDYGYYQRTCYINIIYNGEIFQTIAVQQKQNRNVKLYFSSSKCISKLSGDTSYTQVMITKNVPFTLSFDVDWLAVGNTYDYDSYANVNIYPTSVNTTNQNRTGRVYVQYNGHNYDFYEITQISSATPSLTVSKDILFFGSGDTGYSNAQYVTVVSNMYWVASYPGNKGIRLGGYCEENTIGTTTPIIYTESANTGGTVKYGVVYFQPDAGVNKEVIVNHLPTDVGTIANISASPTTLNYGSGETGSSYAQSITINSDVVYTYDFEYIQTGDTNWITVSGTPSSGTTTLSVYINNALTSSIRSAYINIKYEGALYARVFVRNSRY